MNIKMKSLLLPALSLVGLSLAGCSSGPFASNSGDAQQNARLAAAVQSEYPTTQPSGNINVVAIVGNEQVTLANRTEEPIRDVKVWVNKTFVHQLPLLPPGGQTTIDFDNFYTQTGTNMASYDTQVSSVQLQTQDGFYDLDAPVQN